MKSTPESENLAERLRALYKLYDCEEELPKHDDLVAKIAVTEQYVCNIFKQELDLGLIAPISYGEALKQFEEDFSLFEKVMMGLELVKKGGILGGAVPFILSKEQRARAFMNYHNSRAKKYFQLFKDEVKYDLDEEFRKEIDSGCYNPTNQE